MIMNKKAANFKGKVIPSNYDFQTIITDVSGPHHVWYPESQDDVATAIDLSQNIKTFVRSGKQVVRQDVVDHSGGIVINLSELKEVSVTDNMVVVEAAATSEDVVEQLIEHKLALPLSNEPLKSIASNVLNENVSYLTRSLGALPDYISELNAVEPDGTPITFPASTEMSHLDRCRESKGIITQVTFEAVPAKDLWMQRFSFPYPGYDDFLNLTRALFLELDIPNNCDLVLDFYSSLHQIPIVRITALGSSSDGELELKELVAEVVAGLPRNFASDIVEETLAGSNVLEAIAEIGLGAGLDPTINSERLHSIAATTSDRENLIVEYVNYVHHAVSHGENEAGNLHRDLQLSTRLQINRDNALEVSGYAYTPKPIMEYTTPTFLESSILASSPTALIARPLHEGVPLPLPLTAPSGPIPNFQGDIFESGDRGYRTRAKVYATSSYPKSEVTPLMVAYPRDENDIMAAIAFARSNDLYIVARSGGHQYSGKSSGGQKTIVLSMDAFNHLRVSGNIAEVGSAVSLTELAATFKREGITIPHGECPLVAIGGHAQTGGYGHLVRSFGLALDHIEAFDIVLADESLRTVTRPAVSSSPSTDEERLNQEIFWGVLGGNAGSFGIVTNYKFKCIQDSKHPNSYGYSATKKYSKDRFHKLMEEVKAWTEGVEAGTLPAGIDFMMTVQSQRIIPFPILLVELVHGNLGGKDEVVNGDEVFRSIIKAASSGQSFWERWLVDRGNKTLSNLSDSFVRRWPATTHDGREFKYPYKKRINCTTKALTDTFIEKFVDMVDEVVHHTEGVKLVFQMVIGGGAYQNTKSRSVTSIPHRDYVFCFVFDLFYKKGFKATAEELQDRMQLLVDNDFSQEQEQRVFWGSFRDTDMSKEEVRQMYYDSKLQYARLQKLKKRVDPKDIFHTTLTVQLPN